MAMLDVNHLSIQFGGLRAVDGFNLKIEKDSFTALSAKRRRKNHSI